ncbi:MAG: sigma-54-dependent Fis family transcriptional regulator [Halobacteriovoraceae bacterium]|nr:sigma-54-dependent Fis family transcriptional regulator [Halobacteriovoraceae bacterium]MBT5093847.1 sigma-54-dependent Fis family transcriptional regulator [Halobacteriovoraceae bacterium]
MVSDLHFLHQGFTASSTQSKGESSGEAPSIYLVEDDHILGSTIKKFLEKKLGMEIQYFVSPNELLRSLEGRTPAEVKPFCLVTDISFDDGGADGLLLIDILKERGFFFASIAMTGFASIETAINATKKGVFHYLTKPFELDVLGNLVIKAIVNRLGYTEDIFQKSTRAPQPTLTQKSQKYKIEFPNDKDIYCGMIGRSPQMKEVFDRIRKVAASDSTVLINGPSGTGKELVANAIHALSSRKNNDMISVNCGAIPSELLESELFGHVKGSFTGAISDRKGRFELADKGSIFLDEIGDMPLLLQVKLLRVLQNRKIEKVGGTAPTDVDVRIVTATHRDLEREVLEGNFREDLFYRLNVIPIKVPSLAQRKEDIPLLISYFLSRFVSADGRNNVEFSDDALELLMHYDWPGNVRELENLIERLIILRGGSLIKPADLPAKILRSVPNGVSSVENLISLPDDGMDLKRTLANIEDSLISQALERTRGNKNQASKLLQMNRTTLIEKMKKKGLLQPSL